MIDIDGEPWMVATDVCRVLGYNRTDNAMRLVAPDQRRVMPQLCPHNVSAKNAPHHKATLVSESGFYKLVNKSRTPEAEEFQDWVERVVLPAIRMDGGYVMGEEKLVTPRDVRAITRKRRSLWPSRGEVGFHH